ncbi:MAG: exodeoxyribonuclease VII small subunit [Candidatus Symbiobacter sp.]|nr:exodeoxyribonuclease VII small subunit [Candidatus Symbiobacter sp.]
MTEPSAETKFEDISFEDALRQLDEVVKRLEAGQDKLDDALAYYERGMALRQYCAVKLAAAQARIDRIEIGAEGQITLKPMSTTL